MTYDHYGAPTDVVDVERANASVGGLGAGVGAGAGAGAVGMTQKRGSLARGSTYGSDDTKMSLLANETQRDLGLGSAGYAVEPFVPSGTPTPEGGVTSPGSGAVRFRESEKGQGS